MIARCLQRILAGTRWSSWVRGWHPVGCRGGRRSSAWQRAAVGSRQSPVASRQSPVVGAESCRSPPPPSGRSSRYAGLAPPAGVRKGKYRARSERPPLSTTGGLVASRQPLSRHQTNRLFRWCGAVVAVSPRRAADAVRLGHWRQQAIARGPVLHDGPARARFTYRPEGTPVTSVPGARGSCTSPAARIALRELPESMTGRHCSDRKSADADLRARR